MTGLELLKAPEATAGEIADIISAPCPPTKDKVITLGDVSVTVERE